LSSAAFYDGVYFTDCGSRDWIYYVYLLFGFNMSNRDLHFRGQMHDEEVITFFRDHWVVLIPKIISFVLFMAIMALFLFNIAFFKLPSLDAIFFQAMVVLIIIASGFMIHRFFLSVIEYFLSITLITNYRIIHRRRTLYIFNHKESIYMRRIQDIQKQQDGLFKNILQFGELVINVLGPDLITLTTVPNPEYHFRLLNRIRNQHFSKDQQHREHVDINSTKPLESEISLPSEK